MCTDQVVGAEAGDEVVVGLRQQLAVAEAAGRRPDHLTRRGREPDLLRQLLALDRGQHGAQHERRPRGELVAARPGSAAGPRRARRGTSGHAAGPGRRRSGRPARRRARHWSGSPVSGMSGIQQYVLQQLAAPRASATPARRTSRRRTPRRGSSAGRIAAKGDARRSISASASSLPAMATNSSMSSGRSTSTSQVPKSVRSRSVLGDQADGRAGPVVAPAVVTCAGRPEAWS